MSAVCRHASEAREHCIATTCVRRNMQVLCLNGIGRAAYDTEWNCCSCCVRSKCGTIYCRTTTASYSCDRKAQRWADSQRYCLAIRVDEGHGTAVYVCAATG